MTTIATFWDGFDQPVEAPTPGVDLRTELIETLWNQWVNSLSEEAVEQREYLRQMAADFSSALR